MSKVKTSSVPDFDTEPTGRGRVRGFSGSGVTANFESQKEVDDHEEFTAQKEAGRRPASALKTFRFKENTSR